MHALKIKRDGDSETIMLDNFKLEGVTEYEIKSSATEATELVVKIIIKTNEIDLK